MYVSYLLSRPSLTVTWRRQVTQPLRIMGIVESSTSTSCTFHTISSSLCLHVDKQLIIQLLQISGVTVLGNPLLYLFRTVLRTRIRIQFISWIRVCFRNTIVLFWKSLDLDRHWNFRFGPNPQLIWIRNVGSE
jgi:hypothetical protein